MDGINYKQLLPVLTGSQMKFCDTDTISSEPISSIELMERASRTIYNALFTRLSLHTTVHVVCGFGNNGGDGLCLARFLLTDNIKTRVSICLNNKTPSEDFTKNLQLLQSMANASVHEIKKVEDLVFLENELILDCIFGTGLNSTLDSFWTGIIHAINAANKMVISIDIPSGMFSDRAQDSGVFVQSYITYTIQSAKPSFFYPENKVNFEILDVGIHLQSQNSTCYFLATDVKNKKAILNLLPARAKFGHKGNNGHALLIGGNKNMHGAISLAAESCLAFGAGLTTVLSPAGSRLYLSKLDRVMHIAKSLKPETLQELDKSKYTTLTIGPGLDTNAESVSFLTALLHWWGQPLLLDADALNIISRNPALWKNVPPHTIITPHTFEFERLFGATTNGEMAHKLSVEMAKKHQIYILAKGVYSALYTPGGECIYNGSGGAWLAQGGSGDRLTGIIAALWARTGNPGLSAMLGMYMAGLK